jgi:NTP pyrophosphatase (non-canonical NTP hydrolase)
MDGKTTIYQLKGIVRDFIDERDWDQFHNAKDLAIGVSTEAGELLDIFRFKTQDQIDEMLSSREKRIEIGNELADVLYFVLNFSYKFNFDLSEELKRKLLLNASKYPKEK